MDRQEKIVTWTLQILVLCYATYATFSVGKLKDEQIKSSQQLINNLKDQSVYWKDRSDRLKESLTLMMREADSMKSREDKLVDKLSQTAPQDPAIKSIKEGIDKSYGKIDNIFRESIPVSYPTNLQ